MLALATHEPFFAILREEVVFGRKDQERKKRAREKAMEAAALQHEVEEAMIAKGSGNSGKLSPWLVACVCFCSSSGYV